jgi:subtilisin family serine protease
MHDSPRALRTALAAASCGLLLALAGEVRAQQVPELLSASVPVANEVGPGRFASDHLLVQLAPGVLAARTAKGEPTVRSTLFPRLSADGARVLRDAGVAGLRSLWIEAPRDAKTAAALGLDRWYRADLHIGTDAATAAAKLRRLKAAFSLVELDGEGGLAEIPNDASFSLQYALRNVGQVIGGTTGVVGADVDATTAWNTTHGSDILVAVLDSGIDPHVELSGRILAGINVPDGNTITLDECNHGTHVAGIIAAAGGNGAGIAGVSWSARLLPVVVVNGCSGFESNVATGLTWAVDQGARVVNMSLQFYAFNTVFQQAVQYAHAQGALMCAATGNNGNTLVAAPARWNETIAVAATDNRDIRYTSSNFGPEVDISAPGVSVFSLSGTASYTYKTGTSMATPHVAGAAALIWGYNPSISRDALRSYLIGGVTDLGDPGTDVLYGAGRLDIAASIALVPPPSVPADLNGDGVVNGADLTIMLSAWGPCPNCDACPADLTGDCVVGGADITALLSAW